ncbi:MAG TPA: hypothetical protein VMI12_14270 [Puia sp.]|nr:hypothetical protein [Puia sp.]
MNNIQSPAEQDKLYQLREQLILELNAYQLALDNNAELTVLKKQYLKIREIQKKINFEKNKR